LFSVDFTGNYAKGNTKGKLTYKIRKTNENKNLQEVNQQISNNLKLNVKVNQDKKKIRQITDVIPLNKKLDCNNGDVDKCRKKIIGKKNISTMNNDATKLSVEDKYSSNKIQWNQTYKAMNKKKTTTTPASTTTTTKN